MSAHTPGPWQCFYKHKYDEWHVSIPIADSSMKWALFEDGVRSQNPEADARLIAAAPDLLEALKRLMHHLPRYYDEDEEALYLAAQERARFAIAKATGGA